VGRAPRRPGFLAQALEGRMIFLILEDAVMEMIVVGGVVGMP
jgi:hypothetical protein